MTRERDIPDDFVTLELKVWDKKPLTKEEKGRHAKHLEEIAEWLSEPDQAMRVAWFERVPKEGLDPVECVIVDLLPGSPIGRFAWLADLLEQRGWLAAFDGRYEYTFPYEDGEGPFVVLGVAGSYVADGAEC
jgi:hypothetical protein